jgi:hypothetical protein
MDKKTLVEILYANMTTDIYRECIDNAATDILAALEKEREGEVVLASGKLAIALEAASTYIGHRPLMEKTGKLVFIPEAK